MIQSKAGIRYFFGFILFLLINSTFIFADDISLKTEIDKAFMTIGDKVHFKITASHPKNIQILNFDMSIALSDFEVKEIKDFSIEEKGLIQEGREAILTNFTLGEYVIRPVQVQYRDTKGETKTIQSHQLYLTVQSTNQKMDPASDIRGIKGVLNIKTSPWIWIVPTVILMTVILSLLIRHYLVKRSFLGAGKEESLLSPSDEAFRALAELELTDWLKRNEFKRYFFRLSEIVRKYLERRYQMPALESTTSEVSRSLSRIKEQCNPENTKSIVDLLEFCDLVKFAKYIPSPIEMVHKNKQAKAIVEKTKEIPAENVQSESEKQFPGEEKKL
ncbi:MAG: hypothetical protein A3G33_07125 [Omnitrophica bacterium RIFCSPLOWO2_12_FULL_44_17]|uniref:Protein BatD n=1 Tax=Candidatus Danuiimicrobium aquiferis TaxID=1801832 RepID=A0A1G1KYL7_9BACT|nr:MAG: hypothetical protein A3B72_07420 [Omnitrophica bacterium RIFCSPHIGHO2_02_FULL_45_28]OGW90378.1 MAG: hypothetical protein A3E74_07160 [Omnitrophica bacterium RIFCSPHIGHO2_12_FULL_44_12]OGW98000.1 MAG: hypothetical protein A3G33_07125 [Omnitrophica bacterium RIFCSPLOWO2_12_FULL_44_17]OGX03556.1 MAG: hypothetical protein A3J12_03105 [Omnitrophica bacterium RIFCSPLOWO2_02_FULL_44_11]